MIIIWLYITHCVKRRTGYVFGELELPVLPAPGNSWELKEQKRTFQL